MAEAQGVKAKPSEPDGLSYFLPEQLAALLAAIKPHRVGRDGKGFSHVEAYELRAHLNRIVGFARWSEDVTDQECVFEEQIVAGGKTKWTVCYRSVVRLTVKAPDGTLLATYTEGAIGDAQNQPSRADAHDLAAKTSQSQAFKRCCANLGDQFGLSLYRKGSLEPLVKVTLVNGRGGAAGSHEGDLQDAAPVTFRPPDPEPGADLDAHGGSPTAYPDAPPPATPGRAGEPTKPSAKSPEHYRDALLAATDRKAVVRVLRDASLDGHADAEVADEHGVATTINVLAAVRMKATT